MLKSIRNEAEELRDYAVELRRFFHAHPEISREEKTTQARIMTELRELGVPCESIAGTGVICEITGEKAPDSGRSIVLRADIDALPMEEVSDKPYRSVNPMRMHACGHDTHAASLLAAVRLLKARRELFSGSVVAVFQPGEEDGYGAAICSEDERVKNADRAFAVHVTSELPVGKIHVQPGAIMASVDMFKINITGRSSHISRPHMGVDAALIAAETLISLKSVAAGMTDPRENILLGIGSIHAGTTYNILAGSAALEGTIRAFSEETRAFARGKLEEIAALTAKKYGGTAEVVYDGPSGVVMNDPAVTADIARITAELYGAESVVSDREPSYGGDDFAFYGEKIPACYAFVGSADPNRPETCVAVHNERFDVDEDALAVETALYAAAAVDFLR